MDDGWQRAGTVADLATTAAFEFRIGGGDWPFRGFVVRWRGGLHAYRNRCPHRGDPLNWLPDAFFSADGESLVCASHGAVFDPGSGVCLAGPCAGKALESLEVREEGDEIHVRLPAAA